MQSVRSSTARLAAASLAALALLVAVPASAAQTPQMPLPASSIPQFVEALPQLNLVPAKFGVGISTIVTNNATTPLQLSICEFNSKVLPSTLVLPNGARYASTWTWGYIPGAACPAAAAVQDTYLGPVLVNTRGTPTMLRYTNSLPTVNNTQVLAYKYSTDRTLHWADPDGGEMNACNMEPMAPAYKSVCSLNYGEWWDPILKVGGFNPLGIPAVPHLHGGEVPPAIDGGPDAWFTSDGVMKGHDYHTWVPGPGSTVPPAASNEAIYVYPNSQQAAPLWFHDHTLGATRLNVYAGIAGGYYLLDPAQETYLASINFPSVDKVIPLIIQDRMFDTNGQLYFPNDTSGGILSALNPEHPYWVPEFVGDTIVVNGKAWPFLQVEPRRYRFLFLNGSNARTYELFFVNPGTKVMGPALWAVGNDGGFLDLPAKIDPNALPPAEQRLVVMPGERYEVIIDFGAYANQNLILRNVAKAPYPGGAAPQGSTTGRILQVRVGPPLVPPATDTSYDPAANPPIPLRLNPIVRLASGVGVVPGVPIAATRSLTLNEVMGMPVTAVDPVTGLLTAYPGGPLEILVNNTKWSGKSPRTFGDFTAVAPLPGGPEELVSETPAEGTTEIWEIVNTTADAHPIHTHLATFQVVNRQRYDAKAYLGFYGLQFPPVAGSMTCIGNVFCPGFGPPYPYGELSLRTGMKLGGNPDATPYLRSAPLPPDGDEVGWKDTVMAPPGMVTRFVVRFGPQDAAATAVGVGYPFSPNDGYDPATKVLNGNLANTHGYVWHCHIIDHEDNEMMRPDVIVPIPTAIRTFFKGNDY